MFIRYLVCGIFLWQPKWTKIPNMFIERYFCHLITSYLNMCKKSMILLWQCLMAVTWHGDMVVACINSQQLLIPTQDMQKNKTVKLPVWVMEGLLTSTPIRRDIDNWWLLWESQSHLEIRQQVGYPSCNLNVYFLSSLPFHHVATQCFILSSLEAHWEAAILKSKVRPFPGPKSIGTFILNFQSPAICQQYISFFIFTN